MAAVVAPATQKRRGGAGRSLQLQIPGNPHQSGLQVVSPWLHGCGQKYSTDRTTIRKNSLARNLLSFCSVVRKLSSSNGFHHSGVSAHLHSKWRGSLEGALAVPIWCTNDALIWTLIHLMGFTLMGFHTSGRNIWRLHFEEASVALNYSSPSTYQF